MQAEPRPAPVLPKITLGLVFIALGVLLLLSNLQIICGEKVLFYWPLFTFVPFGLERLFTKGFIKSGLGHVLLFLGIFFQLMMMEKWVLLEKGWPIVLPWMGIVLILQSLGRKPDASTPEE